MTCNIALVQRQKKPHKSIWGHRLVTESIFSAEPSKYNILKDVQLQRVNQLLLGAFCPMNNPPEKGCAPPLRLYCLGHRTANNICINNETL